MKIFYNKKPSSMLLVVLVGTTIFIMLLSGIISLGLLQRKLNKLKIAKSQALHIADAGVNYYRWVLYSSPNEYCDGQTCIPAPDYGPYTHEYVDSYNGDLKGYYELYIIPPTDDTRIVTIRSVGWLEQYPNIKRTIEVKCAPVSWSSYGVLSDSDLTFDNPNTQIWGTIHSNGGIRFDGIAYGLVASALSEYNDKSHDGDNLEFGVHTHRTPIDPLPPAEIPERSDVFRAGRLFPVSRISFDLLNNYIDDALSIANQESGMVLPFSGVNGYHITFKSGSKMDIKIVNSVTPPCDVCLGEQICWPNPNNCKEKKCTGGFESTATNGIASESTPPSHLGLGNGINIDMPENKIIFVKDNVWIDGMVNDSRIVVFAFKDPLTQGDANIIINNNLSYNENNPRGVDVIGLVAQNDINIGFYSGNILQIDAALIAKGGMVGRYYFDQSCGNNFQRNRINFFGSIASKEAYAFSHSSPSFSGYHEINIRFDEYLRIYPPPYFPSTGEYKFLSWKEI